MPPTRRHSSTRARSDGELRNASSGRVAGTNDDWLIVVACGSAENFAVGVVNGEDYTDEVAESARSGEYDDLLVECQVE